MNTNDDYFGVGLFDLTQLRKCMHTVDSAECPEVQDRNVTTQLFDADRMIAIDPVKPSGKVRCSHVSPKLRCCHDMPSCSSLENTKLLIASYHIGGLLHLLRDVT